MIVGLLLAALLPLARPQLIRVTPRSDPPIANSIFPNGFEARILMWGKQSTFENLVIRLREAAPADGCAAYSYTKPTLPTAYLVNGMRSCPLTNLIHNAQVHQASALFITNPDDWNIQDIDFPAHVAGVQIHVFLISKKDGERLQSLTQETNLKWLSVEIDFLEYAKRNDSVSMELIFSPDDLTASSLLAGFYQSSFMSDIVKGDLAIATSYTMLHCSSCAEQGFTMAKENCLSGGRYCMKSSRIDDLSGEVMLIQAIKNTCVENILESKNDRKKIGEYYWTFNNTCAPTFDPKCVNKVLDRLGIKAEVFRCVLNSFEKTVMDADQKPTLKISLQDNDILRRYYTSFSKIEHYGEFPMVKINGVVYYGSISYNNIANFVCRHIKDSLKGCRSLNYDDIVEVGSAGRVFKWVCLVLTAAACIALILVCQKKMKKKFDSDLSYKIDQSVSEYLKKSGGADL